MSAGRGLYYFAHPLTVPDADGGRNCDAERRNFEACTARTALLVVAGYNIFSPITHSYPIQDVLGHEPENQQSWYALDNEFIKRTDWDGIILGPGWERSRGCRRERALFEKLGYPVFSYEDIVAGLRGED